MLNGTASLVLGGPPYNFAASMVGLSYISPLVGVAIGSFYTGVVGDKIVLWMARRNKGILEPEHRLWLFAPSLLLVPFGLILWGVGKLNDLGSLSVSLTDSIKYSRRGAFNSVVWLRLRYGRNCPNQYDRSATLSLLLYRQLQRPLWRSYGYGDIGSQYHELRHWLVSITIAGPSALQSPSHDPASGS